MRSTFSNLMPKWEVRKIRENNGLMVSLIKLSSKESLYVILWL